MQLDIVGESPLMIDVIDPLRINAVMMEMVMDTVMMMVVLVID